MRGNDSASVQGTRRKREFFRSGGDTENNYVTGVSSGFNSNSYKIRKSDPPKSTRVTRTTTTAKPVVGAAKPMGAQKRVVARDQAQDNKKKIWSR